MIHASLAQAWYNRKVTKESNNETTSDHNVKQVEKALFRGQDGKSREEVHLQPAVLTQGKQTLQQSITSGDQTGVESILGAACVSCKSAIDKIQ